MCLSIPAKIVSINGYLAEVSAGGAIFKAGIQMIEDPKPGDYILLHAGFAIQKINAEEAAETLKLFEEMGDTLNFLL